MTLTRVQRGLRRFVKRFIYSQLYVREALYIVLGMSRPFIRFRVEATPPSLYLNFALTPEAVERLPEALDLPHPLAPIRCSEGEPPFHGLTLNLYRVSGLVDGLRAEWSLYIREPGSGKPRYLVVDARSSSASMDPVAIVTRAGEVSLALTSAGLASEVVCEDGTRFRSLCRDLTGGEPFRAAAEWVEANDYIYWRNGICDRTLYDGALANASTRSLDVTRVEIDDETRWRRWVDPVPRHVIVFDDALEFAVSPWWNVDEIATGSPKRG